MKQRPDIFSYLDFREFVKDWVRFQKTAQSSFSLKVIAKQAGLTSAYLSMVLNGKRQLSNKALAQLGPCLNLSASERTYFDLLVSLESSESQKARHDILERMRRFSSFRQNHPQEAQTHEYLTRWYYVAIREMTELPDFQLDPQWIQKRLRHKTSLSEIRQALDFLLENRFIEVAEDGKVLPPSKRIECLDEVYTTSLIQFHREFLSLAAGSLENSTKDERNVLGHSIAFDRQNFKEANKILEEAFAKIRALEPSDGQSDSVYYVGLSLFPLTKGIES